MEPQIIKYPPRPPKLIAKHSQFDVWVITFPFSRSIVEAIKQHLPGAWFEKEPMKAWYVPIDPTWVGRLAWFAGQYGFHLDNKAYKLFHEYTMKELSIERALANDPPIPTTPQPLRPFQIEGVKRMIVDKRVIVGDEMGTGKSPATLVAAEGANTYPLAVICPASVKHKWGQEVVKWVPHRTHQILEAGQPVDLNAEIVILNYELLEKNLPALSEYDFQSVAFDEGHYLKNRDSKRARAAKTLASGIPYKWILTGTPIVNRTLELASLLEIIGRLGDFGGFWNFAHHFCGAEYLTKFKRWDFSNSTKLELLHQNLNDICFFRRLKRDVMHELPAVENAIVPMEIQNRQTYEAEEERLLKWLKREKENRALTKSRGEQMVRIEKLKQIAAKGKMDFTMEFIDSFIDYGEKLVVYAAHKEIQKMLLEAYPDAAHILGDDSGTVRKEQNARFQDDPECPLIICSLKAASTGIDLFAASHVIFVELGWTPAEMDQAIARLHRMGQMKSVNAWFLIAEQTIEEEIIQLLDRKRLIVSKATEGYKDVHAVAEVVDSLLTRRLRAEAA